MNRTAIWALLILGLVLGGLPPVVGTIQESSVSERLEIINAGDDFNIELRRYERGWFGSTAIINFGLSPQYIAELESLGEAGTSRGFGLLSQRLSIVLDISHGPVAWHGGPHLGWLQIAARPDPNDPNNLELQRMLATSDLFDFEATVTFANSVDFELNLPPAEVAGESNLFSISALTLTGTWSGMRIEAEGQLQSLSYGVGPLTYSLSEISLTSDLERVTRYLWLGDMNISAADMRLVNSLDPRAPLFQAANARISTEFDRIEGGEVIAGAARYSADSIVAGTELSITDAELRLAVDNLDIAALEEYYSLTRQVAADPLNARRLLERMPAVVERLAVAAPSVSIDPLRFSADAGSFNARIQVNSDPAKMPPYGILNLQDSALWSSLLSGSAQAEISKPLAELIAGQISRAQIAASGQPMEPQQLETLAQAQAGFLLTTLTGQGMLQDDGDNYSTRMTFADGEFTINGYPLPVGR